MKIFNYLKNFEKMNQRYLFAYAYLQEGNFDVFWGLMDDIWHCFHNKLSPWDKRH